MYKPIIFLGVGRSGTSIISEIIFRHEDLAWPSNYLFHFPDKIWINKIRPILDNRYWQFSGQKKQLNQVPFYNKITFRPNEAYPFWKSITRPEIDFSRDFLLGQQATFEEKNQIRKAFQKLVHYQKRKRLAFKLTGPGRISYLHSIFPDAVFIEITREPFANIKSLLTVNFWQNRGMHQLWWNGAYSDEEKQLALQWKNKPALLTALQYRKVRDMTTAEVEINKVNFHSYAYEDFFETPREIISNIQSVAGLSDCFSINKHLNQTKIFDRNTGSKEFFSSEDIKIMKEILGPYLTSIKAY